METLVIIIIACCLVRNIIFIELSSQGNIGIMHVSDHDQ